MGHRCALHSPRSGDCAAPCSTKHNKSLVWSLICKHFGSFSMAPPFPLINNNHHHKQQQLLKTLGSIVTHFTGISFFSPQPKVIIKEDRTGKLLCRDHNSWAVSSAAGFSAWKIHPLIWDRGSNYTELQKKKLHITHRDVAAERTVGMKVQKCY